MSNSSAFPFIYPSKFSRGLYRLPGLSQDPLEVQAEQDRQTLLLSLQTLLAYSQTGNFNASGRLHLVKPSELLRYRSGPYPSSSVLASIHLQMEGKQKQRLLGLILKDSRILLGADPLDPTSLASAELPEALPYRGQELVIRGVGVDATREELAALLRNSVLSLIRNPRVF